MGIFNTANTRNNWGPRAEDYFRAMSGNSGAMSDPKAPKEALRQGQRALQNMTPQEQREALQSLRQDVPQDSVELSPEARQARQN